MATHGAQKVVTTTDPSGHYVLPPLTAGAWTVEATMFGFQPGRKTLDQPDAARQIDFTLSLQEPRAPAPVTAMRGRPGQDVQLQSQLESELAAPPPTPAPTSSDEGQNEAFLVSGSLSQGLSAGAAPDSGLYPMGPGGPGGGPAGPGATEGGEGAVPGAAGGGGFGGGGRFGGGGPGGPGPGGPRGGGARGGGPGGGGPGGGRYAGRRTMGRPGGAFAGNRRRPAQIRGMMFASLDNSAVNAKPFSITGQQISQPSYAHGRIGVLLGGPLVIPKIVKDSSTFFFLSYFATRAKNPYTAVETVPTLAARQGDFSGAVPSTGPLAIYDPQTHSPFPGNTLPSYRISPVAQGLLSYYPLPNQPGLVNNYAFQTSVPQNSDNLGGRVMRNVSRKDRLAFQINFQRRDGATSQPFAFRDSSSGNGINTNLTWTHNFSPELINSARVTFNRNTNRNLPYFANGANIAAQLGIQGTSGNPLNFGPPTLNFTNFGTLSDATPVLTRNQTQGASDSVILVRGRHSFTFGMQFTRNDLNNSTDQNGRGTFNFTGIATSAILPDGRAVPGTGLDLADFLLGLPQSSSIRYGDTDTYFRRNTWAAFAQDDWKARPSLTIDFGLRYEIFNPFSEKYGRIANLDIAPGFTAVSVVTPGATGPYSGSIPAGLLNTNYLNLGPRLGIAWKVPKKGRSTLIRVGYGVYYNGQAYNQFANRLSQQPPFATSNSVNTSAANPITLVDGFISTVPGEITNTYAVNRYYRTPYAQTWSVAIQQELPGGFFLESTYLGTKGTNLDVETLPNSGPSVNILTRNQLGNAVGFTYDSSVGNSILHSWQTRLQRRFRGGISMTAFYTFSKSIDDSSTFGGAGNTVAQNWLDLSAERGLSSFDRRHVFNSNWMITSPFGAANSRFAPNGWSAKLLKDWELSGSVTAETGTPLTARVLGNGAQLAQTGGIGSGRADATGAPVTAGPGFFNLAAFSVPSAGTFGNAGRNTIPGPGLVSVNLAFGRSLQFGESRRRLDLRVEGNNVLNHVNYSNVNTVVNAANYGLPLTASSMRSLSLVLRLRF